MMGSGIELTNVSPPKGIVSNVTQGEYELIDLGVETIPSLESDSDSDTEDQPAYSQDVRSGAFDLDENLVTPLAVESGDPLESVLSAGRPESTGVAASLSENSEFGFHPLSS